MRAIALVLALSLGACASFQNPLNETRLTAIETAYAGALAGFNGYKDLCVQRIIPSSCRTVVLRVQGYARSAQAGVLSARAALQPGSTLNVLQAINSARAAVDAFTAAKAQYGVQ